MESKTFGYARVSTKEQNLDRQIDALLEFGVEERNIICEKQSGKNFDRVAYRALKDTLLREGDTLVIKSLDRLGRNKEQIMQELQDLKEKQVKVKILDLPTTLTDFEGQDWIRIMINNVLIEVLSSVSEQERLTTLGRQREGIEAAKKAGKHLGRPQLVPPDNWEEIYALWRDGQITAVSAMKQTGLAKTSFYKLAKKWEEENGKI